MARAHGATVIASPDTYSADYLGHYGTGAAYCYELVGRQPLLAGLAATPAWAITICSSRSVPAMPIGVPAGASVAILGL